MKTRLGLTAILMLIALMSTVSGYGSVGKLHSLKDAATLAAPDAMNLASQFNGSFRIAKEIDLREVDWSKAIDSKGGDKGTVVVADNGNGDDDEDEGGGDEGGDGGDEEEGGGGGWDRTWDAPKLG